MRIAERLQALFWWLPFGHVDEISAFQLNERLAAQPQPQIIDVRSRAEWRRSHISGSVNVPLPELKRRLAELHLDSTRPVVAICLSAHRSIPAVRLLQMRGFSEALQLQGGMLAWWREEFPTSRASDSA